MNNIESPNRPKKKLSRLAIISISLSLLTLAHIIAFSQFENLFRRITEGLPLYPEFGIILALNLFPVVSIITGSLAILEIKQKGMRGRLLAIISITLSISLFGAMSMFGMAML